MDFTRYFHHQAVQMCLPVIKFTAVMLAAYLVFNGVRAMGYEKVEFITRSSAEPALGVSEVFGRWPASVKLVYDPDDAPASYTDTGHMLTLIAEAASVWERVCGVRIELMGADAGARANETGNTRDGLVRVQWEDMGTYAGRAGADHSNYDVDLGYYPFEDGEVMLSNNASVWTSDRILVNTLVHEMGHLLGLGHSDNPDSVMYANPYNYLAYPRQDDIQAIQVLYGQPPNWSDARNGIAQWMFNPPADADSARTRYLFKPNQYDPGQARLTLSGEPVSVVTEESPDSSYLRLHSGGIGSFNSAVAVDIKAGIVLVDPGGYVYSHTKWDFSCQLGSACGKGYQTLVSARVLKSVPGVWRLYVLDESRGEEHAETLLQFSLPVHTATIRNLPPQAELNVSALDGPASIAMDLTVADPEGSDVDVIWHIPDQPDSKGLLTYETVISGGTLNRSVSFSRTGTYTLFVELRDRQSRYAAGVPGSGNPGGGFQTLLRVTVQLPLASPESIVLQSSGISGLQNLNSRTLGTGSEAMMLSLVKPDINGRYALPLLSAGNSSARFWMLVALQNDSAGLSALHTGDQVRITGTVSPQSTDVGKNADIFIVIRSVDAQGEHWSYRDEDGHYQTWNGRLESLSAARTVNAIAQDQAVEIYRGVLQQASHRVFIGYRVVDEDTLHYTTDPLRLNVMAN